MKKKIVVNLLIFLLIKTVAFGKAEFHREVLKLVNNERKKEGLKPLKMDKKLGRVAQIKSEEMEEKGYFAHKSPEYGTPFQMMDSFGVRYRAAAENIAYGQKNPEEVVKGWMNSKGHRKNILNSNFSQIGIGISKNQPYHWVQMFVGN